MGCASVADVRDLDPRPVRRGLTVVGERLIYELRGVNCLDLETVAPTRKGCAVTRSFLSRVTDLAQLEQAVVTYAKRLAEKLRRAGLGTDHVTVFIHTSEYDRDRPQRSTALTVDLPEATSDTMLLTKAARWARVVSGATALPTRKPDSSPTIWSRWPTASARRRALGNSIVSTAAR